MINTKFEAILESVESAYNIGELTEEQAYEVLELAEKRYGDSLITEADAGSKANIGNIVAGVGLASTAVALAAKFFIGRKNKNDNLNNPEIKAVYDEMKSLEGKLIKSKRELDNCISVLNTSIKNYNNIAKDVGSPTITLVRSYTIPYKEYDDASDSFKTKFEKITRNETVQNNAYNPKLAMKAKKALSDVKSALNDVTNASAEIRTEYNAFLKAKIKFESMIKTKAPMSETNKKYEINKKIMDDAKSISKRNIKDFRYDKLISDTYKKNQKIADSFSDESQTYNHNININNKDD